ncbi:uncharacterized protein [Coffea arabica]|uniref:Uncharacterized protein isoform X1 n=1 Tax=Coffea arabica TaxID=13443 RepID=A0A6P6TY85_COFAR|nr:uncharacterized protein LOC113705550 isoform X1 [Coffea arabica]
MDSSASSPPDTKPLVPPALAVEVSHAGNPPSPTPVETSLGVVHSLWYCFSSLGMLVLLYGVVYSVHIVVNDRIVEPILGYWIGYCQQILMFCLYYYRRHSPYRCIGRLVKSMVEVISVSVALALRQFVGYNINNLILLIGSTIVLHGFVQFMHVAYDISALDTLLGLLMQVLIYTMGGEMYMAAAMYLSCLGVIVYRYASYSAPALPVLEFKGLVSQRC